MKNNEILLDVIGEVDEKLLPELSEKKKKHKAPKWAAIGGLCAAAAIPLALLLPKAWNRSPFSTVGSKDMVLALASLPVMPAYPTNYDEEAYKAWRAAKRALRDTAMALIFSLKTAPKHSLQMRIKKMSSILL